MVTNAQLLRLPWIYSSPRLHHCITLSIADQQEKASRRLAFVLIISLGDPDNQEMASKNFKDRKGCKRHTGELIDRICVDIASSGGTECIALIHGHDRFALGHSVTPNTGKIDRTSPLKMMVGQTHL